MTKAWTSRILEIVTDWWSEITGGRGPHALSIALVDERLLEPGGRLSVENELLLTNLGLRVAHSSDEAYRDGFCPEEVLKPRKQGGELDVMVLAKVEMMLWSGEARTKLEGKSLGVVIQPFRAIARNRSGAAPRPAPEASSPKVESLTAVNVEWGLDWCKVYSSPVFGDNVKVAVLDSGYDENHVDFKGRCVNVANFTTEGVAVNCNHGMGAAGIVAGPMVPNSGPRYGIAPCVELLVGKVLKGPDIKCTAAGVVSGIDWALREGAHVINLSLEFKDREFHHADLAKLVSIFNECGEKALKSDCIIVASAGNNAPYPHKTTAPAKAKRILSVSALLYHNGCIAKSSNRGKIELTAPYSANTALSCSMVPNRRPTRSFSGTSCSAPHVSGCAALWASKDKLLRGQALWDKLLCTATLQKPVNDVKPENVGKGLVQAPQ